MNVRYLPAMLLLLLSLVLAQPTTEADAFNSGLDAYKSGDHVTAQSIFLRALQNYPTGRQVTAMRYMLARSYYKMGDFSRAEIVAKYFFNKHPESAYLDDMHHILGNSYYKQRSYDAALDQWMWVMANSKDPRLKTATGEYVYKTLDRFLTVRKIDALTTRYNDNFLNGAAQLARARKLIADGNTSRAKANLRDFLQTQPDHPYAEDARTLLSGYSGPTGSKNVILYFQNKASDLKEYADALASGMTYAVEEYRQRNPGNDVELKPVAVEHNVFNVVSQYKMETIENDPVAVVAPIDADQAAALAAISAYDERPLIVPLSSQTGLADLSPYTFQMNPDASAKGFFLGNYAAKDLGLKRIAILAPANIYGENFVKSFEETATEAGAQIATTQWYYESAQDFNPQFRAIWRKGIYLAFEDSVRQANPEVTEAQLQRGYRQYLEKTFEPRRPGLTMDSTDIPATGLDAVLVVLRSTALIEYIAPQLAFNNIKAALLGNEGWNDTQQLRKFRDYLEGMVFISAGYFDPESANYRLFMNRYRNTMKETPDRYHLLGYDIMKWMLSNYTPGMTRQVFRERLENASLFQGIVQNVQFMEKHRVNSKLAVLKLNFGQVIPLGY